MKIMEMKRMRVRTKQRRHVAQWFTTKEKPVF